MNWLMAAFLASLLAVPYSLLWRASFWTLRECQKAKLLSLISVLIWLLFTLYSAFCAGVFWLWLR